MIEKTIMKGRIQSNREIHLGVYRMEIQVEQKKLFLNYQPGQFVNLYLGERDLLLPRPFSICDYRDGVVVLIIQMVGEGTYRLSAKAMGEWVTLSSPLGNGFSIPRGKSVQVVGGGCGVAPLLGLSKKLTENGCEVTAFLGYGQDAFMVEEFLPTCKNVNIASQEGKVGYGGTVLDMWKNHADHKDVNQIFACGPAAMLQQLSQYAMKRGIPLEVSLEERMGCGYGACLGCGVWIGDSSPILKKVCWDGPVFDGGKVLWNYEA
jgi:dihydroorotate dehydrogenase electron transfer subunit